MPSTKPQQQQQKDASSRSRGGTTTPNRQHQQQNHHQNHNHRKAKSHSPSAAGHGVANIAVILNRVDLYDTPQHQQKADASQGGQYYQHQEANHQSYGRPPLVEPFAFERPSLNADAKLHKGRVVVTKVPPPLQPAPVVLTKEQQSLVVMDNSVPNPYGPNIDKYWKQRRRLFSRFDGGIQLDEEGWFSVTPEIIADHVAREVSHLVSQMPAQRPQPEGIVDSPDESGQPFVLLDAFCGCGGNAIAFAKQPNVTVLATDVDRSKLRKAAHNAKIYEIPPEKIIFVECNVLFLLEFCYRDGLYVLDQPVATPEQINALLAAMPAPVATESVPGGYSIGGIDLLPRHIDAIFMDPPWGGVDYEVFGKHGYCLEKNMRIKRAGAAPPPAAAGAVGDDFFDCFQPRTKQERKSQFNVGLDESNCINGVELLRLAAAATSRRLTIYDMPRNTNRTSLGGAALAAGYRGNVKLEEHYLNGRLKTVTAYFGTDWTHLLPEQEQFSHSPRAQTPDNRDF